MTRAIRHAGSAHLVLSSMGIWGGQAEEQQMCRPKLMCEVDQPLLPDVDAICHGEAALSQLTMHWSGRNRSDDGGWGQVGTQGLRKLQVKETWSSALEHEPHSQQPHRAAHQTEAGRDRPPHTHTHLSC